MILARLMKAVREQNWLAVGIEFVIVVAGVLLAFQITAWNETQQDRARVARALDRLQLETEQNLATLEARTVHYAERDARHAVMVAAVTSGQLAEADEAAFERAFAELFFFAQLSVQRGAYSTLEQAGDLALIEDRDLAIALNDYQARLDWVANQQHSFRSGLTSFSDMLRPYVFHEPTERPTVTRARVELEAMSLDQQAVSAIVEMARMQAIFANYVSVLASETLALCEALAAQTGRPCAVERNP